MFQEAFFAMLPAWNFYCALAAEHEVICWHQIQFLFCEDPAHSFDCMQLVILMIFLTSCNGDLSLHSVTYQQSACAAVISYQYTPTLQICANLCTEQTDRDETTCFSYSYSAARQMCYLSSDLSLNATESAYTIKGKEFLFLGSTLNLYNYLLRLCFWSQINPHWPETKHHSELGDCLVTLLCIS